MQVTRFGANSRVTGDVFRISISRFVGPHLNVVDTVIVRLLFHRLNMVWKTHRIKVSVLKCLLMLDGSGSPIRRVSLSETCFMRGRMKDLHRRRRGGNTYPALSLADESESSVVGLSCSKILNAYATDHQTANYAVEKLWRGWSVQVLARYSLSQDAFITNHRPWTWSP